MTDAFSSMSTETSSRGSPHRWAAHSASDSCTDEYPDKTIVYDPRLIWNTLDIVEKLGGNAVICKSGHAFIKEKMRAVDATYGGEMSAHHYFKDHWYCDSGMIPFLLVGKA